MTRAWMFNAGWYAATALVSAFEHRVVMTGLCLVACGVCVWLSNRCLPTPAGGLRADVGAPS